MFAKEGECISVDGELISRIEVNTDKYNKFRDMLLSQDSITVIHHNDLDGRGAAQMIAQMCKNTSIRFLEKSYSPEKEPMIINHNVVVIVDYSIPVETMESLLRDGIYIIWLDHHASVIKRMNSVYYTLKEYINKGMLYAVIDNGKCGAMLAKEFAGINELHINRLVELIDDYDRWVKQYEESDWLNSFMFQAGACYPNSVIWKRLMDDDEYLNEVLRYGKRFFDAQMMMNNTKYDAFHYVVENFHGYKMGVVEGYGNSMVFEGHKDEYDLVALIRQPETGVWTFTFYSDKVDVSKLAEMYNGGGHNGAAGGRVVGERPF